MARQGMSQREYEDGVRYHYYNLVVVPAIICIGIYVVGTIIESFFGFELGVAKKIFVAVGGIGYFVYYFRNHLKSILDNP